VHIGKEASGVGLDLGEGEALSSVSCKERRR
jgi:hypothetical protein